MNFSFRRSMAFLYFFLFEGLSLYLALLAVYRFFDTLLSSGDNVAIAAVVKAINTLVIALAMFELGLGVNKEYCCPEEEDDENIYLNIRRTITRFVGTVSIALVLEALIMIIKYSQLELAGNLYYPVSILFGTSSLLIALGVFLRFTKGHRE